MRRSATRVLWAVVFLLVLAGCNTGENAKDSDGDGLADAAERFFTGTDPADPDSDNDGVPDGAEGTLTVAVENRIAPADGGPCAPYVSNGETIKIFLPAGAPGGKGVPFNTRSASFPLHLGTACGLGIQVNFWYWTRHADRPVGAGPPQNPDNSGANFLLEANCTFKQIPPCSGDGKETYTIAHVTAAWQGNVCVVTVRPNHYTGCVTPACCSPFDGMGQCADTLPRHYACPDPPL